MENLLHIVCVHDAVLYYNCQSTNQMTTIIISLFVYVIKSSARCKKRDPLDVLFPRMSILFLITKIDNHLDIFILMNQKRLYLLEFVLYPAMIDVLQ